LLAANGSNDADPVPCPSTAVTLNSLSSGQSGLLFFANFNRVDFLCDRRMQA
jgi:hypothetical protein